MDWDKYRRTDGSIDLVAAATAVNGGQELAPAASQALSLTETLRPIISRQAAATAVAFAIAMSDKEPQ